jgi:hypothetical protein
MEFDRIVITVSKIEDEHGARYHTTIEGQSGIAQDCPQCGSVVSSGRKPLGTATVRRKSDVIDFIVEKIEESES